MTSQGQVASTVQLTSNEVKDMKGMRLLVRILNILVRRAGVSYINHLQWKPTFWMPYSSGQACLLICMRLLSTIWYWQLVSCNIVKFGSEVGYKNGLYGWESYLLENFEVCIIVTLVVVVVFLKLKCNRIWYHTGKRILQWPLIYFCVKEAN